MEDDYKSSNEETNGQLFGRAKNKGLSSFF